MVDSISALASTTTSASESSSTKLAGNFDDFLKLLITQLKNQDPTAPLDTNEFTQQIVQFSSVEQAINTNKNLEALIDMNKVTQNSNIVSFTGKEVEAEGSLVSYSGKEDEDVLFAYNLDEEVDDAFVTIRDMDGNTVFNGTATKKAGRNVISWDGGGNSGEKVPAGNYQVFVTTKNSEGTLNNEVTFIKGVVQGVNVASENPTLIVNGEEIPLDKVRFVGQSTI